VANGQPKEQWGSRIGVIMAVAGSAVGLGNFLRFPGQAAQNGGGAFMVPYFIALLILGIPMCWAEWTMGRHAGVRGFNSAPGIFSVIWRHPLAKYLGALAVIIPLVIYMYYVVIEAWCLGYAFYYLTGDLMLGSEPASYATFFNRFVGANADGFLYARGQGQVLWFVFVTFALNFVLIYRGVSKGIEKFCMWAMPIMVVAALCVLVRVLTLPPVEGRSVLAGLNFMWDPDFKELKDPETWLAASGQIFFSLSVGFGVVVNYASYLKRNDDVALSGLTASSMNEFYEVCLGGLITLPAAFLFLGAAAGTFGTFGLGFNALPNVFAQMPGGAFFGFLWFFLLFLAAITSSLSMLQPVIAFLEEGFGLKRHASAAFLGLITALGSAFVIYFSKGMVALDTFDFWIGTMAIVLLALVQSLLYGWALGIERADAELHQGAHIRVPKLVQYNLKYVVPVFLLTMFAAVAWQKFPSHDEFQFEADTSLAAALDVRADSPAAAADRELRRAFEAKNAELPQTFQVARTDGADDGIGGAGWRILDGEGVATLFHVKSGEDSLRVYQHATGYVEQVGNSSVVRTCVAFILIVLVFTLLLIHIAGKRWHKEGRYAALEQHDAAEHAREVPR
jgi:SNF family Na+-dependent transporter